MTLTIAKYNYSAPDGLLLTRTFNGLMGGPTIRVSPGESLTVRLINGLPAERYSTHNKVFLHNRIHEIDVTNLHTHGLHVSPERGQDDVTLEVLPGDDYTFNYQIPSNHMVRVHCPSPTHHPPAILTHPLVLPSTVRLRAARFGIIRTTMVLRHSRRVAAPLAC